eukprot:TRINITY_DN4017_c0_g3_i1.p1 TRINITY_DN4017_c0_g3~~TRINITY_DN4017_c0_g3_i1.p1  ORF type:complete len:191 (+),score=41.50 TRINITY_DN4017_c0_g3_i1:183-755(+)
MDTRPNRLGPKYPWEGRISSVRLSGTQVKIVWNGQGSKGAASGSESGWISGKSIKRPKGRGAEESEHSEQFGSVFSPGAPPVPVRWVPSTGINLQRQLDPNYAITQRLLEMEMLATTEKDKTEAASAASISRLDRLEAMVNRLLRLPISDFISSNSNNESDDAVPEASFEEEEGGSFFIQLNGGSRRTTS